MNALIAFVRRRIEADPALSGLTARREEARELARAADAANLSRSDRLRLAMQTESKLAVTYTRKRDGRTGDYVVAPYEMGQTAAGNSCLWATDHKHGGGQIHAFLESNIASVDNLPTAGFRPRWPVRTETA